MKNTVTRTGDTLTVRTPIGVEVNWTLIPAPQDTGCVKDDADIHAGEMVWQSQGTGNLMCQAHASKSWGLDQS